MKALVKKESKPGLWLQDVPEPTIGINDVLIRTQISAAHSRADLEKALTAFAEVKKEPGV